MQLTFRPIRLPEDLPLASMQRRDSFVVSFGHDGPFDEAVYARYLAFHTERLPDGFAFALHDGEIVGQVEAQIRADGTAYVNLFYLLPAWRGRGLGQQLHDYAVALLQGQGATQIDLAVSPTNAPAIRFYEKHGYRRLGLRPDAEPPVLEMRLDLAAGRRS